MDSPVQLPQGVGTPYLGIFDAVGNPIMDRGLPIGILVKDFTYEYIEDGINTGQFSLSSNNADLPNHGALKHNCALQLQWGWLLPNNSSVRSPIRKVYIVGKEIEFSSNGVYMTIKFAAKAIHLLNQPVSNMDTTVSFANWLIRCINNEADVGVAVATHKNPSILIARELSQGEMVDVTAAKQKEELRKLDEAKMAEELAAQSELDQEFDEAQSKVM